MFVKNDWQQFNEMGRAYYVAHHGVGFSWARLAICKNTGVESFKSSFQDIQPQVLENLDQQRD